MKGSKSVKLAVLAGMIMLFSCGAMATTITFTASGTLSGLPASGIAIFTTGTDSITISLTDTTVDPTSVIQNISDLLFTTNTTIQGGAELTSSSGMERNVNADGTFADLGLAETGWALSTNGTGLLLNVLGTTIGPAHTLLGDPLNGVYSNAQGSIAGNDPHNPFLHGPISFVLSVPGVDAGTIITSATFSFGTTEGNTLTGIPSTSTAVPEPGSLILLGSGLLGLALYAKKRSS